MKPQSGSVRVIRCGLGDESYVFDMSAVSSVQQASDVRRSESKIADTQIGILLDESGVEVPVFSLGERLKRRVSARTSERQHVVVTHTSHGPLGLMLGLVSHVLSVDACDVLPMPSLLVNPATRLAKGVVGFRDSESADVARLIENDWTEELCLLLSPERLHPLARPLCAPTPNRSPRALDQPVVSRGRVLEKEDEGETGRRTLRKASRGQVVLMSVTDEFDDPCVVGLSVTQIAEVREFQQIIPVPDAPSNVLGFVVWRNRPVPVIDLAQRVGLAGGRPSERLIIASNTTGTDFVAFPAQARMRSLRLPIAHEAIPVPGELQHDSLMGAFRLENSLMVVPNLTSIMTCV